MFNNKANSCDTGVASRRKDNIVAIVGRANVGKSTLFNRLVGGGHAIVDDVAGVTRDRKIGKGSIGPLQFTVIDTPGLESTDETQLEGRMFKQSMKAIEDAKLALMLFDAKEGLTPRDEFFASIIRKTNIPVVLVANKAESKKTAANIVEGYNLGFGEPVAISAEHGEGMAELYEAISPYLEDDDRGNDKNRLEEEGYSGYEIALSAEDCDDETIAKYNEEYDSSSHEIRVAIVGRPNVGKSTLMNALLGEDRVLTGPEAGITRDAVMVKMQYNGFPFELVDTAGMRRKSKVQDKLEKMSVQETIHAIRFAQVVILVLDATMPLDRQDNVIASMIEREGRACVVALNKWDIIEDKDTLIRNVRDRMSDVMPQLRGVPLIPISAEKKKNLDKMMKACRDIYDLWNTRISTSELNRWLESALITHTPPLINGRRLKIRYATQAKTRPPTIILFANRADKETAGYVRYLAGSLRKTFDMQGVPLRLLLRTGKNPYREK